MGRWDRVLRPRRAAPNHTPSQPGPVATASLATLLVALLPSALFIVPGTLASHDGEDRFRCDGGYCQDGLHYRLDCRSGWCTGPSRNFPTIENPHFDDGAWLADDDRVLGLVLNGDARAYPVRIVTYFETVNDTVGGLPVLISYCPLCGSGIIYDRVVDGQELVFYNTGAIWRSDLVMYDLQTLSWWTQIGGDALTGPMHGTMLTLVPSQHVTWAEWLDAHPGTKVLARPVDQAGNDLAPYHRDLIEDDLRGRLGSYSRVTGVLLEGQAIAFPAFEVRDRGVVHIERGNMSLVVVYVAEEAHVYEAGGERFDDAGDLIVRVSDGVSFDKLTGKGSDGSRLTFVPGRTTYWFAWKDFHKDTLVYLADAEDEQAPGGGRIVGEVGDGLVPADEADPRGLPAVGLALAVSVLAAVAGLVFRRRGVG